MEKSKEQRQRFGNYQVLKQLGSGGFGKVYLGEHLYLQTKVAIKVFPEQKELSTIEAIRDEAYVAAQLHHPSIISLLDFGLEHNTPYIVMSYAPYGTLRTLHTRGSILSPRKVAFYVKQIAQALQYIHDCNIVHRDVKPENILLGPHHEILLSDFGIAVIAHQTHSLSDQDAMGTSIYMAPEQAQGKARRESDQYALAIMAYEWLCGSVPFSGRTTIEIAMKHLHESPPQLPDHLNTIGNVVLKALEKDPHKRFERVYDFALALEYACMDENFPSNCIQPSYSGHTDVFGFSSSFSPSGQHIVTVSADTTAQVWEITTGKKICTYLHHSELLLTASWSPDGETIASGGENMPIHLWRATTGQHLQSLYGHSGDLDAICWSPDGGHIASASGSDRTIRIWNRTSGKCSLIYEGHKKDDKTDFSLNRMKWSASGLFIASGGEDGILHIWHVSTGKRIARFLSPNEKKQYHQSIDDLTWFSSLDNLLYVQDEQIFLWKLETNERKHLSWLSIPAQAIALSPNGEHIVVGTHQGKISIWNIKNQEKILDLQGHINSDSIMQILWSPNGKQIVSFGLRQVYVWNVDLDLL